jgi:hypothetical protein
MDVPSAFNRAIRYSVPQYQRSTFDRAIAGLATDVLGYLYIVHFSVRSAPFKGHADVPISL